MDSVRVLLDPANLPSLPIPPDSLTIFLDPASLPDTSVSFWSFTFMQLLQILLQLGITGLGFFVAYKFIKYRDDLFTARENRQARRELQEWFHQNYIVDGAEKLHEYITRLILLHPAESFGDGPGLNDKIKIVPEMPVVAINRIAKLLQYRELLKKFEFLYKCCFNIEVHRGTSDDIQQRRDRVNTHLSSVERLLAEFSHDLHKIRIKHKLDTNKLESHVVCDRYRREFDMIDHAGVTVTPPHFHDEEITDDNEAFERAPQTVFYLFQRKPPKDDENPKPPEK